MDYFPHKIISLARIHEDHLMMDPPEKLNKVERLEL